MGRLLLVSRLVGRDLRRRPAQAALLLLVIMAATTTLTLGLALGGVTRQPYQQTRTVTAGPDVVDSYSDFPPMPKGATPAAALSAMAALARASDVTGHGGPYPVGWATLRAGKLTAGAFAEGRSRGRSAIDQPRLIQGSWVSADGVVVERSFADTLGVHVGTRLTLNRRQFRVAGIAVSAADSPYPNADLVTGGNPFGSNDCGMVWVTEPIATSLASTALPLSYILNLRLGDAPQAPAFAAAHSTGPFQLLLVRPWQDIEQVDTNLVRSEQTALLVGSMLLGLLGVASVAVIVGARMAEQTRRVGLLKAVGSTPGLVAAVLLTENLFLAVAAAAAGLGAGWLAAPLLTSPGSGLVGTAGPPSVTVGTVGLVAAVAVAVAMLATFVPAVRAARVSTIEALADMARPPRRRRLVIAGSRRLPVPLLLGVRLAARRPRRSVLALVSVTITVTIIVAVLSVHARQDQVQLAVGGLSALANPRFARVDQVLLILTITLAALAAVDAVFITQATAIDGRHSVALSRALGATPDQVAGALIVAQLIPAALGALLGIPVGLSLIAAVAHSQGGAPTLPVPPVWWLVLAVAGVLLVLAVLTAVPAPARVRRSPAEILQAESVTG